MSDENLTDEYCALAHHLILSILAEGPCDVEISSVFYVSLNIPFSLTLFCTAFLQLIMVGERTLASYFFKCYEKSTKSIGILLTMLAILLPILLCLFIYYDVKFDYLVMSVLATPPKATFKINLVFILLILSYALVVVHTIFLYRYNKRKNNSSRSETTLELSSKYQMSENVTSSRILWQLTCAQLSIFLIYGILMFSIRIFSPIPRPPMMTVFTDFCYTPPIYCAVMPILCIHTMQKAQNERNTSITLIVGMSSTGTEGWDNYQRMLQNQWG